MQYPENWPTCPQCGKPIHDGHLTCGESQCDEGFWRDVYAAKWRIGQGIHTYADVATVEESLRRQRAARHKEN